MAVELSVRQRRAVGVAGVPAYAVMLGMGAVLVVVYVVAPRSIAEAAFFLIAIAAPVAIAVGTAAYRPIPAWPWWALAVTGAIFTVGGIVREAVGSTGDLSASRNIWPDVIVVPGYMLFAVALLALLRARGRGRHERGSVLDAAILSVGSLVVAWVVLFDPVLDRNDAAIVARLAIVVYLPISVFLVAVAARLAFSSGERNPSYRLLLSGMVTLLAGDVLYVVVEAHMLTVAERVVDAPYAVSYVLVAASALHPSMRSLAAPATDEVGLTLSRSVLVAVALLTPAFLVLAWVPSSGPERVVAGLFAVTLTGIAITRVITAIRAQAASESRLAHQATHDDLTGLPNRAFVFTQVEAELEGVRRDGGLVALVFLDLDQFKLINDTFGHDTGDQLLREAAARLRRLLGRQQLVARLSGDEFVIVAREVDVHGARALGERVREAFLQPLDVGTEQFVTASVGLVVSDGSDGADAASLLRDADTAMYRSKDAGRNTVSVFDLGMRTRLARRVQLERELRRALHDGHLEVHYQPIVSLLTGMPEGVEALARWPRPDGGWTSPAEFVPVAEDSSLIVPLGEWVLEQACADLAAWTERRPDLPITMAVNLSARQLRHADVVDLAADVLARTRAPASSLWLEITETVMMEDTLDVLTALNGLRDLGIRLAADDFGTGFSSISYLKRFPIERVKIDRTFVSGLGELLPDAALVEAVVALAQILQLDVVAEGVESAHQAKRLRALGCLHAQGHLFSAAVPFGRLEDVIEELAARPAWTGVGGGRTAALSRPSARSNVRGLLGTPNIE